MSSCREWEDRLLNGVLEALGPAEARALEEHLKACPSCATALATLQARRVRVEAAVSQTVRGVEPSPVFHARLMRAMEQDSSRPRLFRWSWAAALAGAAALLAVVFFVSSPTGPGRDAGAESLMSWRSPTEGLLRSPADPLLRETPRLGALPIWQGERHDP